MSGNCNLSFYKIKKVVLGGHSARTFKNQTVLRSICRGCNFKSALRNNIKQIDFCCLENLIRVAGRCSVS